ncbi:oleosin-B6 isoform X6 [Drosophila serrata]|uniref:oleosin-B6 isoform X6 n=1 Tax=Drosophila serrata TaxID=7274 RepID=UPI000A1D1B01|nr:oleosin-B6 isoform X6 [Drosophila serrata]
MYGKFWFLGFIVLIVMSLIVREVYLYIKLKVDEWNLRVYARLVRQEMMLRRAIEDRQGNVFSAEERPNNRYGDIFFIEPGSDEANRIRDQLEKDEKDLPSYDEVMRMCNLTTPTAAAAAGAPVTVPPLQSPLGDPAAPISIAALPAPPYSETDPHSPVAGAATVITMEPIEPSTSRAAQIPTSPASAAAPAAGYQRPETSIVLGANVTSV